MLPAGIMAAAHSLGSKLTVQQAKALQAASQCLASGWACGHRPQCWACDRHPCGLSTNGLSTNGNLKRYIGHHLLLLLLLLRLISGTWYFFCSI